MVKMVSGLSKEIVEKISDYKYEPSWMREFRLKALEQFLRLPMPNFGPDLSGLNLEKLCYYTPSGARLTQKWEEVPGEVKETFEHLGVPEAERKFLAGIGAQYDSEMMYRSLRESLAKQGVIFLSLDEAVKKHPDLVKEYLSKLVPISDNKFASLNAAVWSGGVFIYVPKGVKIEIPLQAYFRINAQLMGQFERTIIIADEGSFLHYLEGCTAPLYSAAALHSGVVEIFIKKGARLRYTTLQNWSKNVYNLVTKRAKIEEEGHLEWLDFNAGSKVTMKYPCFVLAGKGAKGEMLSLSFAGASQYQDVGGKAVHEAPYTSSHIISKSLVKNGGISSYRGLVQVKPQAKGAQAFVRCDALILDQQSRASSYPALKIEQGDCKVAHEAVVSRVEKDQQIGRASCRERV